MTDTYIIERGRIPEQVIPGMRLGRHWHYDPWRSR